MCPVGNGSKNAREAESEPSEHNSDGCLVHLYPVAGIKFPFHPDIAEETINNPGHSAEVWSGNDNLSHIGKDSEKQQEADEETRSSPLLNHAS